MHPPYLSFIRDHQTYRRQHYIPESKLCKLIEQWAYFPINEGNFKVKAILQEGFGEYAGFIFANDVANC